MEFYDFPYIGNNDPNWRTHILSDGLKPPTSFCLVSIAINGIVLTVICCMVWIVIYLLIYWLPNGKNFLLFSFSQFSGGKKRDVRVSKLCQGTAQRYCCEWSPSGETLSWWASDIFWHTIWNYVWHIYSDIYIRFRKPPSLWLLNTPTTRMESRGRCTRLVWKSIRITEEREKDLKSSLLLKEPCRLTWIGKV